MKQLRRFFALCLMGLFAPASAETFILPPPGVDVVGQVRLVAARQEETLLDIAREYGIGHDAIIAANPDVDVWYPGENTPVVIPSRYILPSAPRRGLVLNLPEMRLYYYPAPQAGEPPRVMIYAVGIGRQDWQTPLGISKITNKRRDPTWTPPASIRAEHAANGDPLPAVVQAGPDNPLGLYAIYLSKNGYLIHGTNKPWGVGMRVSHGCVRLYPEGIEELFQHVQVGDEVNIINEAMKIGRFGDKLFLEFHQPLEEDKLSVEDATLAAIAAVEARLGAGSVAHERIAQIVQEAGGLPVALESADLHPSAEPVPTKQAPFHLESLAASASEDGGAAQ